MDVNFGQSHDSLFTFLFLPSRKQIDVEFFLMKSYNLLQSGVLGYWPQNRFHKNSLKTEKNHNSSQIIMTSSQINLQNGHEQVS